MDSKSINKLNKLCYEVKYLEDIVSKLNNNNSQQYLLLWSNYDGSANNLLNPSWGMKNTPLLRLAYPDYTDQISSLATRGPLNPSARTVSNCICAQTQNIPNKNNLTDIVWAWGQFIDHTLDLTESNSNEPINIFTQNESKEQFPDREIKINRSKFVFGTSPREQINEISSFLDATNVYGYCPERAYILRRLDGTGKLKTTEGEMPPFNTFDLPNAQPPNTNKSDFYLAGDIRANENILLLALHTLFIREHNRLCDIIIQENPDWEEELIFQHARRFIIGFMQNITYKEFLPKLLGQNFISPYSGYNQNINASISNEFSTVGYRFGHTMVSSNLRIGTSNSIALRDAFFSNSYYQSGNNIDDVLLGASNQVMQEIDGKINDELRNFLFSAPTVDCLHDLATFNIMRGRDHGIPSYNNLRIAFGLNPVLNADDITSDVTVQNQLLNLYGSVEYIDPWIGAIVEDHVQNKNVGELINAILVDQFTRLRDGDRFWFENIEELTDQDKNNIRNTTLSDIINRNTNLNLRSDIFQL